MKKIIISLLLGAMALVAMPNNELELVLISKATQKKAIVLASMRLQDETKEKFGVLYDEYQNVLMQHRFEELRIIGEYAQNLNNMTDEASDNILMEWITAEYAVIVVKKNYMVKFKEVMSSAEVIRYFQIENRIQLMNEMQRANLIPLATPAQ